MHKNEIEMTTDWACVGGHDFAKLGHAATAGRHGMAFRAKTWGSTAEERALYFRCDDFIPNATDIYFRAVDVKAPEAVMFRWLCQFAHCAI